MFLTKKNKEHQHLCMCMTKEKDCFKFPQTNLLLNPKYIDAALPINSSDLCIQTP